MGGDSQPPEYRWASAPVSATRDHRSPEGSCSESRRSDACSAKTCGGRKKKTMVRPFEMCATVFNGTANIIDVLSVRTACL